MARKHAPSVYEQLVAWLSSVILFRSIYEVLAGLVSWVHEATRPWTSRYLACAPAPPDLSVIDCRCNRIKLVFHPCPTSVFNADSYEVQHALEGQQDDEAAWTSDPYTEYAGRVVAPLLQDKRYVFRVRARNVRGVSSWSATVGAKTLLRPVSGGAACKGYTWTQSGIEVTIEAPIPAGVRAKDIHVDLHPTHLRAWYQSPGSAEEVTILKGDLPRRVRSLTPAGASHWELNREGPNAVLCVLMEKEHPARNIKFDFWRCAFVDHPEIDTHYISSDPHVKPMQPVGGAPGFNMETLSKAEMSARPELAGLRGRPLPNSQQ